MDCTFVFPGHVHPYVRRQLRVIVASILWWDTARLGRVAPARSKLKLHEEWYKNKSQKLFQHTHTHTHTPTYYVTYVFNTISKKQTFTILQQLKQFRLFQVTFHLCLLAKRYSTCYHIYRDFSPPRPFEGSGCGWVSRDLSMGENPMPKLEPRSVTLVGWSIMGNLIMTGLIAGLKGKPKGW